MLRAKKIPVNGLCKSSSSGELLILSQEKCSTINCTILRFSINTTLSTTEKVLFEKSNSKSISNWDTIFQGQLSILDSAQTRFNEKGILIILLNIKIKDYSCFKYDVIIFYNIYFIDCCNFFDEKLILSQEKI